MRLRSYGSLSDAFPYSAGRLKFRVDGDDGNPTSARSGIQAYIRASSLLYPRRPQFSTRLSQRPRGKSGEVLASSQAAPTPRLAHHSRRSSYLRPSEHHLHLTPPSIPRPGIQGHLATAEAQRAGKAWTGAWIYLRSNRTTTERKTTLHRERRGSGGRGRG